MKENITNGIKLCLEHNNKATWIYLPSSDDYPFYCDGCVPRGCSCNEHSVEEEGLPETDEKFKWVVENETWRSIDDNGREFPCLAEFYEWDAENDCLENKELDNFLFGSDSTQND